MSEALAEQTPTIHTDNVRPLWQVIEGSGETTPPTGSLAAAPLSRDECLLIDVDDLARFRTADGLSYDPKAIKSLRQNKVTRIKEGSNPAAVSDVEHEWIPDTERGRGGIIRDLGRTAVETAMRGHLFYQHEAAHARGSVEVKYAAYNQAELRPGIAHLMISAKMSAYDAPSKVAKAEGLDETDSIQVNWLGLDESDKGTAAKTTSILVADIPLEAWVDMLADDGNMFGKAVPVSNPKSALSVMQTFKDLDLPLEKLPEGPVSILASVIPYIQDPQAKNKVIEHLNDLRGDQKEMHRLAISPADRWLQFDIATDQSLHHGLATVELQTFIESLEKNWGDEDREVIESHKIPIDGKVAYRMSRELAKVVQKAAGNLILTSAAVVVGNQKVLDQMSPTVARRIYESEVAITAAYAMGIHMGNVASTNNSLIAGLNIEVGGGCCPIIKTNFRGGIENSIGSLLQIDQPEKAAAEKIKELSWHGGVIKEGECTNCKEHTKVGKEDWCRPCLTAPQSRKKAA